MERKTALRTILAVLFLALPAYAPAQSPVALDPGSVECLGCHQDASAVNEPMPYCHEGGCDHPAGASYALAASKNRGLAAPEDLAPGIRLFDGKIGCLTCHTPYTQDHETRAASRDEAGPDPMLSVDNAESSLCVACHLK